jgi:hypothetical protein
MKAPSTFKQKLAKIAVFGFTLGLGCTIAVLAFSMWAYKRQLEEVESFKLRQAEASAAKDWEPVIRDGNPIHLRTRMKDGKLAYRLTVASRSRPQKAVAFALKDRSNFTVWSAAVEADQLTPEDPDSKVQGWFFEGEGSGLSSTSYQEASKLAVWTVE